MKRWAMIILLQGAGLGFRAGTLAAGNEATRPPLRARPMSAWPPRQPPWQGGAEAEKLVGADFTDARFDWKFTCALAGPISGDPRPDDDDNGGEDWDEEGGQPHSGFGEEERARRGDEEREKARLRKAIRNLPELVRVKLMPPLSGLDLWHADGNVTDIDPDVGTFTPQELREFRHPGNGPIGRLPREQHDSFQQERIRRFFEACPFGPDELSENYPFLPPSFRFRFSSTKHLRESRALFPGVDMRLLKTRLQPKFDPLRVPRMMEEHRSHVEAQENKILRALIFLGSIRGHDAHNSRGEVVVEPETVHGQLPEWHERAEMDEKLRMLDSRIQQSVLHSVLDPAGGGQGQNRPLLEQMCLGMEGANVTDMVAEAESILGMLNLSKDELKDMLQTGKCGGEEPGLEEGDDLHGPGDDSVDGKAPEEKCIDGGRGKFNVARLWLRGAYPGDPLEGPIVVPQAPSLPEKKPWALDRNGHVLHLHRQICEAADALTSSDLEEDTRRDRGENGQVWPSGSTREHRKAQKRRVARRLEMVSLVRRLAQDDLNRRLLRKQFDKARRDSVARMERVNEETHFHAAFCERQ